MAELSIDPTLLRYLIVKVRSFMGKEAPDIPDDASNPIEDPLPRPHSKTKRASSAVRR
jgi:hypothetical protein